jgi:hypothetical protein
MDELPRNSTGKILKRDLAPSKAPARNGENGDRAGRAARGSRRAPQKTR